MCKKRNIAILSIAVLLVILTVWGSFKDYQLAQNLYLGQTPKENIFGIIFSYIGAIPAFLGWSFFGASILYLATNKVEQTKKRRWLIALSIFLFVLSFFFFCNTLMMVNASAFSVHWSIAYSIGILAIATTAFLGYTLAKKSNNPELLGKILFLVAITLITAVSTSMKVVMDRPRFRWVLEMQNADYFRNWWESGTALKESLASSAVTDEFSSFPSGHSAYSMFAIFLFPAFADFIPKLEKRKPLLFLLGVVWWALTAFSRLTVGAHYLTDVAISGLVVIAAYAITSLLQKRLSKKLEK